MSKKQPSPIQSFINGGFGGVCTVCTGHPLDTMKVRLQTMPHPAPGEPPMYTGTFDCAKKIFKNEGILGFYKGITAPLNSIVPMFAMRFTGYAVGKKLIQGESTAKLTYPQLFMAGGFSGLFSSLVGAPGERVKCLLQIQRGKPGESKYKGFYGTIFKLFQEGGISSVYRGYGATILRDIPGNATFFCSYEICKNFFASRSPTGEVSFLGTLLSGGIAGITHWIAAMPQDVLKSRIQTSPDGTYPHGARSAFKDLIAKEGPMALYKGFTPVMLRAFPANAAGFFGVEFASKIVGKYLPDL